MFVTIYQKYIYIIYCRFTSSFEVGTGYRATRPSGVNEVFKVQIEATLTPVAPVLYMLHITYNIILCV